jgi:hypothetical protein
MPALEERQQRVKQLLFGTYEEVEGGGKEWIENLQWTWTWMLGECGKWDEKTAHETLATWAKKYPTKLPTFTDLINVHKYLTKKILDKKKSA